MAWDLRFSPMTLASRADAVEASVLRGGCASGERVYQHLFGAEVQGVAPDDLPEGLYGFSARARDGECVWFAAGCVEVQLPRSGSMPIEVVMSMVAPTLEEGCEPFSTTDTSTDPNGITGTDDAGTGLPPQNPDQPPADGTQQTDTEPSDAGTAPPDSGTQTDSGTVVDPDDPDPMPDGGEPDGRVPPPEPDSGVIEEPDPDGGEMEPEEDSAVPEPTPAFCDLGSAALVACWPFDGDFKDYSGMGNDAVGGPNAAFEAGQNGQALRTGGSSVSLQDNGTLDLQSVTMEVWFNAELVGMNSSFLFDNDGQYYLRLLDTGAFRAVFYAAPNDADSYSSTAGLIEANTWTFVAATYDGNKVVLYKDGVFDSEFERTLPSDISNTAPIHLGSGSPTSSLPLQGLIDGIRIFNAALSPAEICEHAGGVFSEGTCTR